METGIRGKTYKIGQAAKLLDVKPFVLRFWESEFGDVLVPVRTPAGQRAYTEANVATVREIKRLLYDEGLTIEGAKKRLGQTLGRVAQIASPAPASPTPGSPAPGNREQPILACTSPAAAKSVAAASAPGPADGGEAEPLRATLRDIRSELLSIRDLLGG